MDSQSLRQHGDLVLRISGPGEGGDDGDGDQAGHTTSKQRIKR